jgi:hypothetical protein
MVASHAGLCLGVLGELGALGVNAVATERNGSVHSVSMQLRPSGTARTTEKTTFTPYET